MNTQDVMPEAAVLDDIKADIAAYEAGRRARELKARWGLPLSFALLALVVYFVGHVLNANSDARELWTSPLHVYLYFAALVVAAIFWFVLKVPARRSRNHDRLRLFPSIFRFVDDYRYTPGTAPETFDRLPRELVGSFNKQSFDDVMSGTYRGFPFELFEAHLIQKEAGQEATAFAGAGLVFEAREPFPGLLIAGLQTPKTVGFLRGLFGAKSLEEVKSGVAALDKDYIFRTDNPEAAQRLVAGPLAQALQWLGSAWPDGKALVALQGGDAFVLLPSTSDFFQLPPDGAPLRFEQDVRPMIVEFLVMLETAKLLRRIGSADGSE